MMTRRAQQNGKMGIPTQARFNVSPIVVSSSLFSEEVS